MGHHHTLTEIDGTDHQILIEADYIANASEKEYRKQSIENFMKHIFKTEAGKRASQEGFQTVIKRGNSMVLYDTGAFTAVLQS